MEKAGFYKYEDSSLSYAAESVMSAEFMIHISEKDNYEYPIYGWYYFESEELAKEFFNVK